jgi:hypothetical protein
MPVNVNVLLPCLDAQSNGFILKSNILSRLALVIQLSTCIRDVRRSNIGRTILIDLRGFLQSLNKSNPFTGLVRS